MELKKIIASEGIILTNGETYGKSITLGSNDKQNNWYEITEEEYQKIIEEQEKLALLEGEA
jgi:hypothetical protein